MDEQMREAFEMYMFRKNVCTRFGRHKSDDTYRTISVQRAWELWQAAALSQPAAQEIDELKTICAETYQVVGSLASDLGIFGSCLQLGKVLDNLSEQKRVHNDVPPWPAFEAQGDSSHPAGGECGGAQVPDFWAVDYMGEQASAKFPTREMAQAEMMRRNSEYPRSAQYRSISAYIKPTL